MRKFVVSIFCVCIMLVGASTLSANKADNKTMDSGKDKAYRIIDDMIKVQGYLKSDRAFTRTYTLREQGFVSVINITYLLKDKYRVYISTSDGKDYTLYMSAEGLRIYINALSNGVGMSDV